MSTKALDQFYERLEDINRLLESHQALSHIKSLDTFSSRQTDWLQALAHVQSVFSGPLRGRRWGMEALNRAGIVLLTAHLEGYVEDLFEEASKVIVSTVFDQNHYDVDMFVSRAIARFGNPWPDQIDVLFALLGSKKVTDGIGWGGLPKKAIRDRLGDLIKLRNEIAHGERPSVTRKQLLQESRFVRQYAKNLDKRTYDNVLKIAGVPLW